jgi:hypothetical protein
MPGNGGRTKFSLEGLGIYFFAFYAVNQSYRALKVMSIDLDHPTIPVMYLIDFGLKY